MLARRSLGLCCWWLLATGHSFVLQPTTQNRARSLMVVRDVTDDQRAVDSDNDQPSTNRWESLHPKIKARIVKAGQQRAIENKKKRERSHDKKRRMMMFMKKKQQEKTQAARVRRPVGFDGRTPLTALVPGMSASGVVISLTEFGAYIDIGSERDGLLHISQISEGDFIEHPRQVLTPGDEVTVKVRSVNPEKKKLHLTMLSEERLRAEQMDAEDDIERIPLDEIQIDDELWGEIKRVTNYGSYVEVGAVVDGFLHFMDHPLFDSRSKPSTYMAKGDRVRVWVADVDSERQRIKLTANRPPHLPGPRRETIF